MEESLVTQVSRYLASQRKRQIGYRILTCMAAVVVFCTVYALILPAITMSNELTCGMENHQHDESCYALAAVVPQPELVCDTSDLPGLLLHTHNSYCYDNNGDLICTLTEREAHQHGRSCYQEHQNLICDQVQELGHAHDASCYARDRGELICTTPEGEGAHQHVEGCLQVETKEVLSCGKSEEPAHTHDDSCYTTTTKEVLVCTEWEEPAHSHGSSCYTTRTNRTLVCTESESDDEYDEEGNLISSGHRHSGGCYETEEETEFTCTKEETAGHQHDSSCYETREETLRTCSLKESEGHTHDESCYRTETETTVLCGQEESKGHVHDDKCYTWSERLTCTQEERPAGHIHDDSCYESSTTLACGQMEMEEHVHGESCYDGEGELTCTRREISSHQHTAACVHIPESGGEEELTVVCGLPEHVHVDGCYVDLVPEEEKEFFCGIPEHVHSEECYFEDGVTLRCTMPEHIHDDICREPPVEEKPTYIGAEGVYLDDSFDYETDAFLVTFHVSGYAPLVYTGEMSMTDDMRYTSGPEALGAETGADPEPQTGSEPAGEPVSQPDSIPVDDGETGTGSAADSGESDFGGFDDDYGYSEPLPEDAVLLDPADVEFHVEALEEGERKYDRIAAAATEMNDDMEPPLLQVLTFSAEIDGQELDLSQCDVEVEVTLSELLLEYLASYSQSQPLAIGDEPGWMDEPGAFDGSAPAEGDSSFLLMACTEEAPSRINEVGNLVLDENYSTNETLIAPLNTSAPQDDTTETKKDVALVLLPCLIGRVGKGAPRSLDRTDRPGKQLFYGPNYEEPTNREIDRALKKMKGQRPDGAR